MGLIEDDDWTPPVPRPRPPEVPLDPGLRPPEPDPPTEPPYIPPGINPGDEVDDPPYTPPESEPEPQTSLVLGEKEDLLTKTGTYGGVGSNCRSRSTNWNEMAEMPYWYSGSIQGYMTGSTLTLSTPTDSWMMDDSLTGVVAENSYVEMDISVQASGGTWGDFVESLSICLEGDDYVALSVGSSIYDFSIVKNGMEVISSDFVAELNTLFSSFTVTLTITRAVHCSQDTEQTPSDWGAGEGEEGAIDGTDDSQGGSGAQGGLEWTQADAWVLLGVIVLIMLGAYVLNTTRGAENGA